MVTGGGVTFAAPAPPQPTVPATRPTQRRTSMKIVRRRRTGTPSISRQARTAPPLPSPNKVRLSGRERDDTEPAFVVTVTVAEPLLDEGRVMLAGFKLQAGRLCAPVGELVRAQDRLTFPEYVALVVRVTVIVSVAPAMSADGMGSEMATGGAGTPVPLNKITCGLSSASSVIVTVPVRCPVAVGLKTTAISQ